MLTQVMGCFHSRFKIRNIIQFVFKDFTKKQLYRHMTDTNPAHFILINFVCVYFLWCHREVTKSNQLEAT